MQKKSLIAVCFFLLMLVGFNIATLGHPPIWPDEAEYADVAKNIALTGQPISTLHQGLYKTDWWVYGYPPVLFLILSVVIKLFGFSIEVIRTTSVIAGVITLVLFYLLSRKVHKKQFFVLLPIALMALDMTFLRTSRVARPEIFVMLFSFISYYSLFYLPRNQSIITASIFGTLAVLTHPMGAITLIIIGICVLFTYKKQSILKLTYLAIPPIIGVVLWQQVSGLAINEFIQSIEVAYSRKYFEPTYLEQLFMGGEIAYTVLYLSLLTGSIYACIYFLFYKVHQRTFLVAGLLISWIAVISARSFWYFAYPLPFLYLSYSAIIKNELDKKLEDNFQLIFIAILLLFTTLCNVKVNLSILSFTRGHSYELFSNTVAKYIPDGSSVFTSSIPDPYFILKKNPSLTLRQFPGLPGSQKQYLNILKNTDYVVYTQKLDFGFGNMFTDYLKAHTEKTYIINNGPNEYKAVVIKLRR